MTCAACAQMRAAVDPSLLTTICRLNFSVRRLAVPARRTPHGRVVVVSACRQRRPPCFTNVVLVRRPRLPRNTPRLKPWGTRRPLPWDRAGEVIARRVMERLSVLGETHRSRRSNTDGKGRSRHPMRTTRCQYASPTWTRLCAPDPLHGHPPRHSPVARAAPTRAKVSEVPGFRCLSSARTSAENEVGLDDLQPPDHHQYAARRIPTPTPHSSAACT